MPVRALLIVTFALVCPGFAWVRLLGLEDRLAEWTLGVAASIAIGTLVASLQAYAGAWSPAGTIILLALVVLAAIATELVATRRRPQGRRHDELGDHRAPARLPPGTGPGRIARGARSRSPPACCSLLQIQEGALRIAAHGRDRVTMRALRAMSIPIALIFGAALAGHFVRFFQ